MNFEDVQHLLPASAKLFIQLIGLPRTVQLIQAWGGTTFPMSKNQRRLGQIRFEALAEVIGVDAAKVLTQHFGGETLAIPRCSAAILEMRNRAIREEFDELTRTHSANHAASELARKYHITDRWVYQVLSRADSHGGGETIQGGLF